MSAFDTIKKTWNENQPSSALKIDNEAIMNIIKSRAKKQVNAPIRYFWGALVLQIILYSILFHIIIKYHEDTGIFFLGWVGVLLYLPFTYIMVRKFSSLAILKQEQSNDAGASLKDFVLKQKETIQEFYSFKMKYELFLIPVSTVLGTYLFFTIFFPGGVMLYWKAAVFTFLVTFFTSVFAILSENRKQFKKPIQEMQQIIDDFKQDE